MYINEDIPDCGVYFYTFLYDNRHNKPTVPCQSRTFWSTNYPGVDHRVQWTQACVYLVPLSAECAGVRTLGPDNFFAVISAVYINVTDLFLIWTPHSIVWKTSINLNLRLCDTRYSRARAG